MFRKCRGSLRLNTHGLLYSLHLHRMYTLRLRLEGLNVIGLRSRQRVHDCCVYAFNVFRRLSSRIRATIISPFCTAIYMRHCRVLVGGRHKLYVCTLMYLFYISSFCMKWTAAINSSNPPSKLAHDTGPEALVRTLVEDRRRAYAQPAGNGICVRCVI